MNRTEPPSTGSDRVLLNAFLDFHRQTLALKCEGLTPAQLTTPAAPPSTLTLLGLVRHLSQVELVWFQRVSNQPVRWLYRTDDDPDADFTVGDPADATAEQVAAAWQAWHDAVAWAREVAAATDLDAIGGPDSGGDRQSLRWVLIHLVEEYARHNGHADLLREAIDGAVGE
jgi:uncharacterized damage-inducible protein DinB